MCFILLQMLYTKHVVTMRRRHHYCSWAHFLLPSCDILRIQIIKPWCLFNFSSPLTHVSELRLSAKDFSRPERGKPDSPLLIARWGCRRVFWEKRREHPLPQVAPKTVTLKLVAKLQRTGDDGSAMTAAKSGASPGSDPGRRGADPTQLHS